ncbi:MAG: hypothetical protein QOI39_1544 [Mycobacterium sp.]|nr:hypothetical protein [Mycobacterium sp.]
MTDDTRDADLENHIKEFLTAINERPDQLIQKHIAGIKTPNPQDMDDFRRYVNDLKRIYGQGLEDMYQRIASHGLAICGLTNETGITEPVEKIMTLAAVESEDVPKLLAGFEEAASQPSLVSIMKLLQTISNACAREVPIQAQRDELTLDFTTYCLTRFPPTR